MMIDRQFPMIDYLTNGIEFHVVSNIFSFTFLHYYLLNSTIIFTLSDTNIHELILRT